MRVVLHRDPFHPTRAEPAGFALPSDGVSAIVQFAPAETTVTEVSLADGEPFHGNVIVDGKEIAFSIDGVRDADELNVRFTSATHAEARVTHAAGAPPNCRAICADGSEGQPCVTCRNGDVTTRICC